MSLAILTSLGIVLTGFFVGSLPLGTYLVKFLTGKDIRHYSAHNLGVENLFKVVGAPVALGSFFLDMLKGFLLVLAFPASPWAAFGVFLGHLYPLAQLSQYELPRGRGNGVLLGVLAAWAGLGMSWYVVVLPVFVYAGLLALSRFVSLATVLTLAFLVLCAALAEPVLTGVSGAIFLLALWRHKASLLRMLEGLEPKLGEPPAVFDFDPKVIPLAFMIHPLHLDDIWQAQSFGWLKRVVGWGFIPETWIKALLPFLRPQLHGVIEGIRLADERELRVLLIGGPMLPEQIRKQPEAAVRMAIRGARLAQWQGAKVFGLGAFWSTVGDKGLVVQRAVPGIAVTNGGAYTAATVKAAIPELLTSFKAEGANLKASVAAVVGANGVVAFGIARMIAAEVAELILIGRDETRLARSSASLHAKYPETLIRFSTDIASCEEADLVFSATSDPDPVIFAQHVKPGAWLFDLGRPADIDLSVRTVPGVHLVPGGVVKPPGEMRSSLDIHFGNGLIPACLAETMIMAASEAYDKASLGDSTKTSNIDFYLSEASRLGFSLVSRDEAVQVPKELV